MDENCNMEKIWMWMKLNNVNETCQVNDIRPCGLEMEKFDMEKSFHMGEMDDNKKWYGHINEVK